MAVPLKIRLTLNRGRGTYCLEVKQVVTVSISLQLITAMWLKRNKISIIDRIFKICNAEVYCVVLPVLLASSTVNFKKKKKKSCRGNNKN